MLWLANRKKKASEQNQKKGKVICLEKPMKLMDIFPYKNYNFHIICQARKNLIVTPHKLLHPFSLLLSHVQINF